MGAGHRDAVAKPHQLGEHLRAGHHGQMPAPCFDHFRVVACDCRRHDHDLGMRDVSPIMADVHSYPEIAQPRSHRAGRAVRSGDLETQGVQHLRDAAHSRPADAHEVHAAHPAHAGVAIDETRAAGRRISHASPPGIEPPRGAPRPAPRRRRPRATSIRPGPGRRATR